MPQGELQGGTRIHPFIVSGRLNVQSISGPRISPVSIQHQLCGGHVVDCGRCLLEVSIYAKSGQVMSSRPHTLARHWLDMLSTTQRVPQQSISPSHGEAVGRYAGECCQNVGSWRDLRQVL